MLSFLAFRVAQCNVGKQILNRHGGAHEVHLHYMA
jgi:hypothetical protein